MVVIQWDLMEQGYISACDGVCDIRQISFHGVMAEEYSGIHIPRKNKEE